MDRCVTGFDVSKAISLMFHGVYEKDVELPSELGLRSRRYALSRACFRKHLSSIKALASEHAIHLASESIGWQKVPTYLTFDDGTEGAYTCIADDLESFGWNGHFFIVSDWIDRSGFLNRSQIRELRRRGHVVGSHSQTHPAYMCGLSWTDLLREWRTSCDVLNDVLGERITGGSVPNGYYVTKVARAAAASGLRYLFTSEPKMAAINSGSCRVLGRYLISANTPPETAGAIVAGEILPRWKQAIGWNVLKAAKRIGGDVYLDLREELFRR
jgi:peptidoglycan/xylan/chitin deacetylase (PgdA/CDA1 family)